jgi:hypothetical protein
MSKGCRRIAVREEKWIPSLTEFPDQGFIRDATAQPRKASDFVAAISRFLSMNRMPRLPTAAFGAPKLLHPSVCGGIFPS